MKTYRERSTATVQAEQWFPDKDGKSAHPYVQHQPVRIWDPKRGKVVEGFSYTFSKGYTKWIIWPGWWIVQDDFGDTMVRSNDDFRESYEEVDDDAVD